MRLLLSVVPRLLLPLIALYLPAAFPAFAQQEASVSGYSVHGTVVNAATGQPVARALVDLNDQYAMLTGGDGQFSFDNLPAGVYMASVRKPGYIGFGNSGHTFQMHGAFPARTLPERRIQVGADMPSLTFRITPESTIAGIVSLSTSDPADGIQVMVYRRELESGHSHWSMAGLTKTRSDGSFRMADLPPGSYMIYTQSSLDSGESAEAHGPVWGYPAVYYPGVTDPSAAGIITLAPGQQAEADFTLTRQQFFPVTALVRASDEDRPSDFEILDSGGRNTSLPVHFDRRAQVAMARVPSGTWTLEVHSYGRTQFWGRADFQVAGAPVSFALSVVPAPAIPVIIHRDFSTSSGDQPVSSGPGMNLFLEPADEFGSGGMGGSLTQSPNGDGSWELNVFHPGKYWVVTDPYPPAYVSSITLGGQDLASTPLVVAPGSSLAPLEVTLRNDPGSIAGQVNLSGDGGNQNPAAAGEQRQIWIYAIPLFSTSGDMHNVMPGDTGQFTFYNLAPGSYRVVACDAPQEIDFHSAEAMAAWAGKGQTVTVNAGETANAQLNVIHMETAP